MRRPFQDDSTSSALHEDLSNHYDKSVSPRSDVAVNVTLVLDDLLAFDDDSMTVRVTGMLYLHWEDERYVCVVLELTRGNGSIDLRRKL